MSFLFPLVMALGPLALVLVGLTPQALAQRNPRQFGGIVLLAAGLAFCVAVLAALALALNGPAKTGVLGVGGAGLSLYLDALSATMFLLVSFVGAIVVRYSRNYLDGDDGQARFMKWLSLTLASVLVLILSGNLIQFILAWVATSLCLHQLLVFYADRPGAQLAARKKFLISRVGDLCLIGACVLIYQAFGSFDFATIFGATEQLRADGVQGGVFHGIAILLVTAAVLKSAQFPFHAWLPDVMETPTPVSALLHAGIINAGGFLIVRLSDVVLLSTPALDVLTVIGAVTALFGSVVMLTQTSVKVSLAYSTLAQMGFMMLQCGLGAFSSAVLHIVAHSLYKAHAFLSSGSVINLHRAAVAPVAGGKPHPWRLGFALIGAVGLLLAIGWTFGHTLAEKPGPLVLGAILLMGLTHLIASSVDERPTAFVIGRGVALAAAVTVAYFALQVGAERLLASALPTTEMLRGPFDLALIIAVVAAFGIATVLQSIMPFRMSDARWQAAYVHIANGLYINTLTNRLVQQLWPVTKPTQIKGA